MKTMKTIAAAVSAAMTLGVVGSTWAVTGDQDVPRQNSPQRAATNAAPGTYIPYRQNSPEARARGDQPNQNYVNRRGEERPLNPYADNARDRGTGWSRRPDRPYDWRQDPRNDPRGYSNAGRHDGRGYYPGEYRRWNRGDRLPPEYRSSYYVVNDWHGHHLHRPPPGYYWVQNGSDYLLVAIATGIIASVLLNQ